MDITNKFPITVLLPAYNAEMYISESIDSILSQTFRDFEFLIINDGSTDHTKEIILRYQDKRIRYIENRRNQGLVKTLNKGLYLANGNYIARMDADDLCSRDRLEKQLMYFERDKEVDILGTNLNLIGSNDHINYKLTNEENRIELLMAPPIAHPSVMIKKQSLIQHNLYYDKAALYSEDYKLWIDASLCGLSIKNIEEYLYCYRIHPEQVSSKYKEKQLIMSNYLRIGYGKHFFNSIISGNEREYIAFILGLNRKNKDQSQCISLISEKLLDTNKKNIYFDKLMFEKFIEQRLSVFDNQF